MFQTAFHQDLNLINREHLSDYLCSLSQPCYESALMKVAFPELNICAAPPLALWRHHFLLYHALYQMQQDFEREQRYLHIHFMRTYLLDYPAINRCRWYDPYIGSFCGVLAASGDLYCDFHRRQIGETFLDALSERYFYLDPANYEALDEATAAAFINGAWEILSDYSSYQQSFQILGIAETSDLSLIRKRFRALARQCHPDMGRASAEEFNRINNAYRLLLRMLQAFSQKR